MAGLDAPVELGAEFIHGTAEVTHALLRRARVAAVDSNRAQRYLDRGRLKPVNAFREAQRAVGRVEHDVSFARFLARRRLSEKTKLFARMMVQGFDAADPAQVSARAIVEEWGDGGSLGDSQPRPQGGYSALFDWLAESVIANGARLQLGSEVREVAWRQGGVAVRGRFLGRAFEVRGRAVIITLPLGVLQSGFVRFKPALREKREALEKLASGPVIRVAMRFHERFWEKRARNVAFFHVPAAPFPTFWTPLPMRAALLTAWAGGPKASRLTGTMPQKLVRRAMQGVKAVFGEEAQKSLAAARAQDWQADPYALGGYSYLRVGGAGAREALAAPLTDTLFFAGEATDPDEAGTVAGALRSGQRAARELGA